MSNAMILGERLDDGHYEITTAKGKMTLTRGELKQLVFEGAERLRIFSFRCRDCTSWARFSVEFRPQYPLVFVCPTHLTEQMTDESDDVRQLPAATDFQVPKV